MSKILAGYVGDGHGQPLAGLAVVVSMVEGGLIVTEGTTDATGMWSFTDLPDYDEHFVTVRDGQGRAVVRGPWSGEMRDLWIRDRLALAHTAQALLPPGANTWVGGVPLVVDPATDNTLTWTAAGLHVPPGGLTQAAADTRYVNVSGDTMTGNLALSQADAQITLGATAVNAPGLAFRSVAGASAYSARISASGGHAIIPGYGYLALEAARVTTEGLFRADGGGGDYTDVSYDGLVIEGDDYGSVTLRGAGGGRLAFGGGDANLSFLVSPPGFEMDGAVRVTSDLTVQGGLTVASKPVALSPDGANTLEWRANGFYAPGSTGLTQAAGDLRYEPIDTMYTKAESDTRYVNATGDTMSGQLIITSGGATIAGTVDVTGNIQINGTIIPSAVDHRAIVDTAAASPWLLYNHPASYARILWRRDQAKAFQVHDMDVNAYLLEVAQTSGNTLVRGTLDVGGALTTHNGDVGQPTTATLFFNQAKTKYVYQSGYDYQFVGGGLTIATGGLTVSAGGAAITGTLAVTGAATISTTLAVTGNVGIGVAAGARKLTIASATPDSHVLIGTVAPSIVMSDNANKTGLFALATAAGNYGKGDGDVVIATYGTARGHIVLDPNYSGGGADRGVALQGNLGFYGTAPVAKQTVSGARASNAALTSLLTALAALGIITNSSTA